MADSPSTWEEVADTMQSPTKQVWKFNLVHSTLPGVFMGMLCSGIKEASASVSKDAGVMLKMGSAADKLDAKVKRFLRVARGSLAGGVRGGMWVGFIMGMTNLLADVRGVHAYDVYNLVGAGSIACPIILFQGPGSLARRARLALLGVVIGAGTFYPSGLLIMKAYERKNQQMANSKFLSDGNVAREIAQSQSRVDSPIDRLENSLQKK